MSKFAFEKSILQMNAMYRLPIASVPSLSAEMKWQWNMFPEHREKSGKELVIKRLEDFFGQDSILAKELTEYKDIVEAIENGASEIDVLVMLADLLGDIQVYCASEMARFGLPNQEVLEIIMASNASKLDANGNPIYDAQGKFEKGPNYWKPEPKIRELLISLQYNSYKNDGE